MQARVSVSLQITVSHHIRFALFLGLLSAWQHRAMQQ